ncbi:recombinase family protein [Sphingopyxis granuli]|uniref:recombinase family protein n=1 Tax=Sphingopyxis granuli TaxID=267128 RepID=UPI001BAFF9C7|nr:recombinase family protein [Sphingopyxis granuli]QUM73676.1 recombinase family protein [Sphingopyxis granuli]
MLATIYARFSSAEQAKGTSIARQLELCTAFAKQHGWQVSDTLKEEGKSGYSGANRSPGGKLYEFEQAVERGQYINGHALIVEHLDRITRQGWEQVLPFLQKLTANGVGLGDLLIIIELDRAWLIGECLYAEPDAVERAIFRATRLRIFLPNLLHHGGDRLAEFVIHGAGDVEVRQAVLPFRNTFTEKRSPKLSQQRQNIFS